MTPPSASSNPSASEPTTMTSSASGRFAASTASITKRNGTWVKLGFWRASSRTSLSVTFASSSSAHARAFACASPTGSIQPAVSV